MTQLAKSMLFVLLLFSLFGGCTSSRTLNQKGDAPFSFALIGDMPYGPTGIEKFDYLVNNVNTHGDVEWVLHVGDIKTGGMLCSDDVFQERLSLFQQFEIPFVFIPGDNEWTDCHRESAGGYHPLERLDVLRTLFYPEPGRALGGGSLFMETQAAQEQYRTYPEHVRWVKNGVVFAGLHIVGSANGLAPFAERTDTDDKEAAARMKAAIDWMREAFREAERLESPGLFLMIHANPLFENGNSAFRPFLEVLEEEVIRFGLPVLLAHGDSHYFRIDKPLMGSRSKKRIENFTRVETFGAGDIHWLQVHVDPAQEHVFTIQQKIVSENKERH